MTDGSGEWVVRTPPRRGRTPSAHDVAREHRVTAALGKTEIPVPRALLLSEDESILGVPFTVAEFVPGCTIQSLSQLDELGDDTVTALTQRLVETLAALHRVDYLTIGLASFGKPNGYAARQMRRWSGQWDLVGAEQLGPLATDIVGQLTEAVPEQSASSIVHGDFRIDNAILDLTGGAAGGRGDRRLGTLHDR